MENNNFTRKISIYQVLPRLFTNKKTANIRNGTIEENGCGKLNDISDKILEKVKTFGFSHIWYTGVIAHATQTSYKKYGIPEDNADVVKGKAGSAYAIKDYYDIDPDLAVNVPLRMQEFENLIVRTHKAGLKAIIDFVPNHVARQYKSLAKPLGVEDLGENDNPNKYFDKNNNFYYLPGEELHTSNILTSKQTYKETPAKVTGNNAFTAWPSTNDWYETVKLNYGIDFNDGSRHFNGQSDEENCPSTWNKMLNILLFWAGKGVDAFRCDMAEMVPVDFWHFAISRVKRIYPHILFIAEVYNPNEYRNYLNWGKFDFLYDKVGLYDKLRDIICGNAPAWQITHCWQSNDDIQNKMLHFLENHDEQRIASDFFCGHPEKALPAIGVCLLLNKAPIMIYSGQEQGERGMYEEGFSGKDGRTSIFDYWQAPPSLINHAPTKLSNDYKALLQLLETSNAANNGLLFDLMYVNMEGKNNFDAHHQYAFMRSTEDEHLLIVANFSAEEKQVGVVIPKHAFEYLSLKQGNVECIDLLQNSSTIQTLNEDGILRVSLCNYGVNIIKINYL